jgi:hypothetical protein
VKKLLTAAMMLALGVTSASAQSLEDLNIQVHGYATQGFIYTTQNNIFTTSSSNGSPAWSEAVLNVSSQPIPKLRVAVQGRYFLLGNYGNAITLDWASADYKVNDRFGVRFGKVKTPNGLFNETQDIDPSYIWSLLPQSVYPLPSRNSLLTHTGGVAYGTFDLGHKFGKIEYRGWGGERLLGSTDAFFVNQVEAGLNLPNGLGGMIFGGAIHWKTPLPGLTVGISDIKNNLWSSTATAGNGALSGTETINHNNQPSYFAKYEKNKIMVAYEYYRLPVSGAIQIKGIPTIPIRNDDRDWYAMASYRVSEKFTAGIYDSQITNKAAALGPARFQKDWAISGRYDFNQFLYAKAEQHFVDGTAIGYDTGLNPNGLKPDTRMTIFKIGVNF